jgi:regulator of nonsense transcripts 1
VMRITAMEEIALELHTRKGTSVPAHETTGFAAELLWNATAYDRMHAGLQTFAVNPNCMSQFLYHQILGHNPVTRPLRLNLPTTLQAPNLPAPNHSQIAALEAALRQPFTMIQGPPGTGKTVTSTTVVWLLHRATREKVLMAAPSNVAVDHLAEKMASTGLKARLPLR